jgi:hypothetical protein
LTVERYIKAGIISFIVLVGFVIVFGILPNSIHSYSQYFVFSPDENSVKQKFLQSEEYQTFTKRFPDNHVDFSMTKYDARFSVSASNSDTQNILILNMYDNFNENRISKSAECNTLAIKSGIRYSASEAMVKHYLETTKCLESTQP